MADIFISYSSEDKTIVKHIASLLEAKGWSVWWDRQIPIGQKYDTVIDTELQKAGCVIVIWTQRSISSEWVKNEALDAAQKNILVPVVLEHVILPLAFRRIESSLLYGWDGHSDHPELPFLYNAISAILHTEENTTTAKNKEGINTAALIVDCKAVLIYSAIAIAGLGISISLLYYYLHSMQTGTADAASRRMFYLVLILFGISTGAFVFGIVNLYTVVRHKEKNVQLTMAGPATGLLLVILGSLFLAPQYAEDTVTIRVSDWKNNPLTQGNVKIYLNEYIRTQSIDNMGQALFTRIPAGATKNKIKIEVSSPGYATRNFDTLLVDAKPMELVLPLTTVVLISGRVKTAAELPIKGVEIDVDGTRYYAVSITDGTYNLRLEEYTLGDEVTLTTSHPDFEDKTILLRISSPNIQNEDIFLNPVKKR